MAIGEAEAAAKVKAKPDPELSAIRQLNRILERITDTKARQRVLEYVRSRVEGELKLVAAEAGGFRPVS